MAVEEFANNATTTLNGAITSGATTLVVTSATGFSTAATGATQFRIAIDTELMLVTNTSGTTFTVTRGIEGTTAAAHANGAGVYQVLTAQGMPLLSPHYPGVNTALTNDSGDLLYSTGVIFADNSGNLFYGDGVNFAASGGNNILDDGTGSATITGNISYAGQLSGNENIGVVYFDSNTNLHLGRSSTEWAIVDDDSNQVVLGVFSSGGSPALGVKTLNNTLDDGNGGMAISGGFGVNSAGIIAKPVVSGSRGGNAALASLLTALASYGLITNSTSA